MSLPATTMPPAATPFDDFLARLRRGDDAAAAELYDRFCDRLLGLAERHFYRQNRGPEDPADVVQTVFRTFFARVRDGLYRLDSDDDLRRLLFQITVNKCVSRNARYAAAGRDPGRVAADADPAALLSREPTADDLTVLRELYDRIDAAVRDWPAADRLIVERALAGEKPRDTVAALGAPGGQVGRVRERLTRLLVRFNREP